MILWTVRPETGVGWLGGGKGPPKSRGCAGVDSHVGIMVMEHGWSAGDHPGQGTSGVHPREGSYLSRRRTRGRCRWSRPLCECPPGARRGTGCGLRQRKLQMRPRHRDRSSQEGRRDNAATAPNPPGLTFPPVQVPLKLDPPGHDLEELH